MESRLITPELAETLTKYPLYSQDSKKKDAICICVFFIGRVRWYVLEGQPEGDDFTLFTIVVGMNETEYGYASINEMEAIEIKTGIPELPNVKIQRDRDFVACPIGFIQDAELQEFLTQMEAVL
ncbi:Protein of unknown function [Bacteroides ovatus]|jgi:hypothetical protein|uniref:DUF2958 domain-containing protein n=1 Tax=Bacteroides ovatus TaxID=28116 RepID=A0A1G6G4G3_BACOV|nr:MULTISPECIES: DUF2958 domain-containing protein [Bacteroidales]KKB45490.1 hypothetical protein HMPREF1212_05163 [Parabacteroides sp. HGS0025]MBP7984311.1 DUF2958 domain-containing protein [Bacteroidaceae bacterium]MBP9983956.1 DUF2958 domain-containing protein [Prevotella sp.]SDB76874.1 Protein of unknown function [Bacteroides ovatus]